MWADSGTLINELTDIESGETYYIAAFNSTKYYTVPNTSISGQTFTCSEGSLSGSTLTVASGAGEFVFTAVSGVDDAYYIYNTNLKKYLVATGSKTFGYVESSSNDYGYWTFSAVTSGGFSGAFSVKHSNKTHYMRAYNSTVKCYDGTSNNGVYFFKKDPSNKVTTPSINGDNPFILSTEISISSATLGASIQYSLDNGSSWIDYADPFTLTETTTVKAKATKSGLTDSDVASATFTKVTPMTVAEAIAYIDLGENLTGQYVAGKISIIDSYSSGKITYWISDDGTTTTQMEVYKGKGLNGANFTAQTDLAVGDEVVVSGDLQKYGDIYEFSANSQLLSFTPKVKAPTFSPVAGAVAANTEVTISTTTGDATIYYTTDGTTPTISSNVYSTPITIDVAKTIKAFAVKDGHPDSDVATAEYTIAEPCATPTFSVEAGEVAKGTTVTISTTTEDATIYYTTDGSTPTISSTLYSNPITINAAITLKAIAVKDNMANSEVAEASYTVRDYVLLPFEWDGGTSDEIKALSGVTGSGIGNYAETNAPYRIKMDTAEDYIQIKTNSQVGKVSIGVKMIGGATTSKIKVQESTDGTTFTDIEEFTISGNQNDILNFATTNAFNAASRYVKIIKSVHGSNIGVGPISIKAVPISYTMNQYEWSTLVSDKALDFTETGVKAYVVTGHNGNILEKTEVTTVAANTPLLLNAAAGDYKIPVAASGTDYTDNKLVAGTGAAVAKEDGKTKYVLSLDDNGNIAFLKINNDPATVPADKAYLEFNEVVAAPSFDFGDATAIDDVRSKTEDVRGDFYNLNGQRVANPTKGLYIVNGKKVIVK